MFPFRFSSRYRNSRGRACGRTTPASCGFPSPADDYLDRPLDFNELLISNPAATFAVRIAGESMRDAGLFPGDIAIVDRSLSPLNGCVVLALIDGEFTIKRYRVRAGAIVLQPENRASAKSSWRKGPPSRSGAS